MDRGVRGQQLAGENEDGDHGHPGDAHNAQRHQHQHQSDARADAVEPELESRADALAAASAELMLERRELVDAAAIATDPAATDPCGRYNAYTATPTSVQTAR